MDWNKQIEKLEDELKKLIEKENRLAERKKEVEEKLRKAKEQKENEEKKPANEIRPGYEHSRNESLVSLSRPERIHA